MNAAKSSSALAAVVNAASDKLRDGRPDGINNKANLRDWSDYARKGWRHYSEVSERYSYAGRGGCRTVYS